MFVPLSLDLRGAALPSPSDKRCTAVLSTPSEERRAAIPLTPSEERRAAILSPPLEERRGIDLSDSALDDRRGAGDTVMASAMLSDFRMEGAEEGVLGVLGAAVSSGADVVPPGAPAKCTPR